MIDGLIFDVDGTIWDSTGVVADAWNKAIEEAGYEGVTVTADTLRGLFGLPMLDIMEALIPGRPLDEKEKFLDICTKYEFEFLEENGAPVYEGLEDTLKELSKKYKLSIVSNCQCGYIELMLRKTGFDKYFKKHIAMGDTGLLKADNIKRMVEQEELKNAVYVGDIYNDYKAACEAGVAFAHAKYGFGKVDTPDYVINTPSDLLGME